MKNDGSQGRKKTLIEKLLDVLALAAIMFSFLYIVMQWPSLPTSIPLRLDSSGTVSSWGDKKAVLGLPVIAAFVWIIFTVIEKRPHNINLPLFRFVDKTKQLRNNRIFVNIIKNAITIGLLFVNWNLIQAV